MPQYIDVAGKGLVEFPDDMSQEDIESSLRASIPPKTPPPVQLSPYEQQVMDTGVSDPRKEGEAGLTTALATVPFPEAFAQSELGQAMAPVTRPLQEKVGKPIGRFVERLAEGSQRAAYTSAAFLTGGPEAVKELYTEPVSPIAQQIEKMPGGAARIAAQIPHQLARTLPQMAGAAALTHVGLPLAVAGAVPFAFDKEGFSPSGAALGAGLPLIGKYSGKYLASLVKDLPGPRVTNMNLATTVGAIGGPAATMFVTGAKQVMALPKDQRAAAWSDLAGQIAGMVGLGPIGAEYEKYKVVSRPPAYEVRLFGKTGRFTQGQWEVELKSGERRPASPKEADYFERHKSEQRVSSLHAEDQQHIDNNIDALTGKGAKGEDKTLDVEYTTTPKGREELGGVMGYNHKTGKVEVYTDALSMWIQYLRQEGMTEPEIAADIRAKLNEEFEHSNVTKEQAVEAARAASPWRRALESRIYTGKWSPSEAELSEADLGWEILRRQAQRAKGLNESEFVAMALHEKMGLRLLQRLTDMFTRRKASLQAQGKPTAAVDKQLANVEAATQAVATGKGEPEDTAPVPGKSLEDQMPEWVAQEVQHRAPEKPDLQKGAVKKPLPIPEPKTAKEYRDAVTGLKSRYDQELTDIAKLRDKRWEALVAYFDKFDLPAEGKFSKRWFAKQFWDAQPTSPAWGSGIHDLAEATGPKKSEAVLRDEKAERISDLEKKIEWSKEYQTAPQIVEMMQKELNQLKSQLGVKTVGQDVTVTEAAREWARQQVAAMGADPVDAVLDATHTVQQTETEGGIDIPFARTKKYKASKRFLDKVKAIPGITIDVTTGLPVMPKRMTERVRTALGKYTEEYIAHITGGTAMTDLSRGLGANVGADVEHLGRQGIEVKGIWSAQELRAWIKPKELADKLANTDYDRWHEVIVDWGKTHKEGVLPDIYHMDSIARTMRPTSVGVRKMTQRALRQYILSHVPPEEMPFARTRQQREKQLEMPFADPVLAALQKAREATQSDEARAAADREAFEAAAREQETLGPMSRMSAKVAQRIEERRRYLEAMQQKPETPVEIPAASQPAPADQPKPTSEGMGMLLDGMFNFLKRQFPDGIVPEGAMEQAKEIFLGKTEGTVAQMLQLGEGEAGGAPAHQYRVLTPAAMQAHAQLSLAESPDLSMSEYLKQARLNFGPLTKSQIADAFDAALARVLDTAPGDKLTEWVHRLKLARELGMVQKIKLGRRGSVLVTKPTARIVDAPQEAKSIEQFRAEAFALADKKYALADKLEAKALDVEHPPHGTVTQRKAELLPADTLKLAEVVSLRSKAQALRRSADLIIREARAAKESGKTGPQAEFQHQPSLFPGAALVGEEVATTARAKGSTQYGEGFSQRMRAKAKSAIYRKRNSYAQMKRGSPDRRTIEPEEIDWDRSESILPEQRENSEELAKTLTEGSSSDRTTKEVLGGETKELVRRKAPPVTESKALVVLQDKRTKKVHVVSAWREPGTKKRGPVMMDPFMAGETKPIIRLLGRYAPLYKIMLHDPVKRFHKTFDSVEDFNRSQFHPETIPQPVVRAKEGHFPIITETEEGSEFVPSTEVERGQGGSFTGTGALEARLVADLQKGALQSGADLTDVEAGTVYNAFKHVNTPEQAAELLNILRADAERGTLNRKDRMLISSLRKVSDALDELYDFGTGEAAEVEAAKKTIDTLYALSKEAQNKEAFVKAITSKYGEGLEVPSAPEQRAAKRAREQQAQELALRPQRPSTAPAQIYRQFGQQPVGWEYPQTRELTTPRTRKPIERVPWEKPPVPPPTAEETAALQRSIDAIERNARRGKPRPERLGVITTPIETIEMLEKGRAKIVRPLARVRMSPEAVGEQIRDYISNSIRGMKVAGNLEDNLYVLQTRAKADGLQAIDKAQIALDSIDRNDAEQVLYYADDMKVRGTTDIKLTPAQQKIHDEIVAPLQDANTQMAAYIRERGVDVPTDTYFMRMALQPGSLFEQIKSGVRRRVTEGSLLSKAASFMKRREIKALEDEQGNRVVAAIVGKGRSQRMVQLSKGVSTDLGEFRYKDMWRNKDLMDAELKPYGERKQRIMLQLNENVGTPFKEKVNKRRIQDLTEALAETQTAIDGILQRYPEAEQFNKVWEDKNGKRWKLTDATVREIEANSRIRYYKDPVSMLLSQHLRLSEIYRATVFLNSMKNSPQFAEVGMPENEPNRPAGWRPTSLPAMRGYVFDPRIADVMDHFHSRSRGRFMGYKELTAINTFLRNSIFFNPLIHLPNLLAHYYVARGQTRWLNPKGYAALAKWGPKAFKDVITKSPDYITALEEGMPLMHTQGERLTQVFRQMIDKATGEATTESQIRKWNIIGKLYRFSNDVTWISDDVLKMTLLYETMERFNLSLPEAIHEVSKHLPAYRIPARIMGFRTISKIMSEPNLTMFGAYHYGALASYGHIAKELGSGRWGGSSGFAMGADRVLAIATLMGVLYPIMDKVIESMTGDSRLRMRRAGPTTFPHNVGLMAQKQRQPWDVIQSVATPAVGLKSIAELLMNREMYSGRPVYSMMAPGAIPRQIGRFALTRVAPIQQAVDVASGARSPAEWALGLAGVQKAAVPEARHAVMLKEYADMIGAEARTRVKMAGPREPWIRRRLENDRIPMADRERILRQLRKQGLFSR